MNADEYQRKAASFAIYPMDQAVIYPTLGLVGEAGEVAEKVKKIIRSGRLLPLGITREEKEAIVREIGDVLWYAAVLADEICADLSTVMAENIRKLEDRRQRAVIEGDGDNR